MTHNGQKTHCKYGHEFSPENTRVYPYRRMCIACDRGRSHSAPLEVVRAYRRTEEYRAQRRKHLVKARATATYKAREVRHARAYRERYPEKAAAKRAVRAALASGALVRPAGCSRCGESPRGRDGRTLVHAHHEDYSKQLEVVWLCVMCHSKEHRAEASKLDGEDAPACKMSCRGKGCSVCKPEPPAEERAVMQCAGCQGPLADCVCGGSRA